MAYAQRIFANEKVRIAKLSKEQNLHFNHSNYTITFNFAQNLELPHFGEKQPGDIYYFSPLTLNVFGIIDYSLQKDQCYCFTYHEGEGKKGSNNVASLVK